MAGRKTVSATQQINKVTGVVIRTSFRVIVTFLIVMIFYWGITSAYQFGLDVFSKKTMTSEPGIKVTVVIREGDSALSVGKELEKKGLIHSAYAFAFQKYFYDMELVPGSYTLDTAMTVKEALQALQGEEPETEEESQ